MTTLIDSTYQAVADSLVSGPNEALFNNLILGLFSNMQGSVICPIDTEYDLVIGCLGYLGPKPGLFVAKKHSDKTYISVADLNKWHPILCNKETFSLQLESTINSLIKGRTVEKIFLTRREAGTQ